MARLIGNCAKTSHMRLSMARKPEADSPPSPAKSAAQLKHIRSTIDKLDLQILKLVNERAALAAEIGRIKTDHGGEIFSPAREEDVYQNTPEQNNRALDMATILAYFTG